MAFNIGQTIGQYEFIDVLDSSKTGVTYKIRNTLANRFETLKVLAASLQNDQESVNRFLREMQVRARMVHPNIVTFYNAFPLQGQLVMTTELIEGVTFADRLELGRIPVPEALHYICQVLDALSCAHGHGVIHRDITPANLLITPTGTVKLAGFALAKSTDDVNLTQAGRVLGSLHYMSPEQVKGAREVDARSDIYSAGIVLYQTITGRKPFDFQSQFDIMAAHVSQPPVPPMQHNRAISPELDHFILKALAKNPGDRFQTAEEFRASLSSVLRPMVRGSETQVNAPVHVTVPQQALAPIAHTIAPAPLPVVGPVAGRALPTQERARNIAIIATFVLAFLAIAAYAFRIL
jgi:serine/threonine protein kinase